METIRISIISVLLISITIMYFYQEKHIKGNIDPIIQPIITIRSIVGIILGILIGIFINTL